MRPLPYCTVGKNTVLHRKVVPVRRRLICLKPSFACWPHLIQVVMPPLPKGRGFWAPSGPASRTRDGQWSAQRSGRGRDPTRPRRTRNRLALERPHPPRQRRPGGRAERNQMLSARRVLHATADRRVSRFWLGSGHCARQTIPMTKVQASGRGPPPQRLSILCLKAQGLRRIFC